MSDLLKTLLGAILFVICGVTNAFASLESISEDGINSVSVPYTGNGISIGQVEPRRPGKPGLTIRAIPVPAHFLQVCFCWTIV